MNEEISEEEQSLGKRAWRYAMDWIIALALTGLGFWLFSMWRAPNIPDQAPSWELVGIDGETYRLDNYKGKTVVLNFWATWCKPCVAEIPEFIAFAEAHPEIPVLGINTEGIGAKGKVTRFARKFKVNYPIVFADAKIGNEYDVEGVPMTVVVAPDGKVEYAHVGMMTKSQLESATQN